MEKTASKGREVVLVTVTGPDKPGITSELAHVLATSQVNVLDIGQAVIHGLLSLSLLFEVPKELHKDPQAPIKDLLFKTKELGLKLDFEVCQFDAVKTSHFESQSYRYAVTLIGDQITAESLYRVTSVLASYGINIDTIQRLSEKSTSCIELLVSSLKKIDQLKMRKELLLIAQQQKIDIALQSEGLFRKSKRLVVLDMDSTLIQNEVIDELARQKGVFNEVAKITEEAMQGKIDFDESLRLRCRMFAGLKASEIEKVFNRLQLTSGAQDLILVLKQLGYKIAIISGGFSYVAERFKERLGIDYAYTNILEEKDGVFTGEVIPPILNAQRKADLLDLIAQREKISLDQVIAIGDGANDLLMLEKAGLGIAFNAKPSVRERADMSLNQKNLRSIFYLLGISARDIDEVLSKNKTSPTLSQSLI